MSITITLVTGPEADKHPSTQDGRQRTLARPAPEAEVQVFTQVRWPYQQTCEHEFVEPTRFGDATCFRCHVQAWSPNWVIAGVFGETTEGWIERLLIGYTEQAAVRLAEQVLGAEVIEVTAIIAELDKETPAALPPSPGKGRKRPGLPVPTMPKGVMEVRA